MLSTPFGLANLRLSVSALKGKNQNPLLHNPFLDSRSEVEGLEGSLFNFDIVHEGSRIVILNLYLRMIRPNKYGETR